MRNALTIVHRYCGLASMVFLALAGLTGSILVLRGPLDRALNPDLLVAEAVEGELAQTSTVPIVARYERKFPDLQVVAFPANTTADDAIELQVSGKPGFANPAENLVYLDPTSGEILGSRSSQGAWSSRGFVAGLAEFHYNLLALDIGRYLMGVIAILWTFSSLAGIVMTFPERGPFWKNWWRNWQFRRSSPLPQLLFDLHRSTALWLLPAILMLALTSVALNFWSEAYAPTVTKISPLQYDLFEQDAPYPGGAVPDLQFSDALLAAEKYAEGTGLEWKPARMLYLPDWNLYGVKFSKGGYLNYEKLGPVDYYFDGDTGEFRHQVDPYSDSAGLTMIRMVYPLHSGEVFGTISLVIIFVAGLVTLLHSITGFYIWLKKRKSRVAQRAAAERKRAAA